jgi:hypothetical protein
VIILTVSFYILSIVVVLGLSLSLFHLGLVRRRWRRVGVLHGLTGAVGLGVLLFALRGPPRGFAHGVQSFGEIAAILAAAGLAAGGIFFFFPRAARGGWLIGAHATLGIAAFVFLSGYLLLG